MQKIGTLGNDFNVISKYLLLSLCEKLYVTESVAAVEENQDK